MTLGRYIAVAGNIGAGKSSFVEFLQSKYDIEPVFEPNEANPFLEDFYGDMGRWSIHSQLYFLAAKLQIHRGIREAEHDIIQDRTLWEDAEIFAAHLGRTKVMAPREYETYRMLYESVADRLRPPDLMIYLRCPVRTLKKRIKARGRPMEQDIPTAYLRALHVLYEEWFARYDLSPTVVFETGKMDPVTDIIDAHDIQGVIDQYLKRS
ncbi:MAG: deoxyadenosine/deoxycytidine kinase [Bradymonadia bacterium]|jgi:deoxyadenosine/deoxycytidine kinase